jgi:hypothetical protein
MSAAAESLAGLGVATDDGAIRQASRIGLMLGCRGVFLAVRRT